MWFFGKISKIKVRVAAMRAIYAAHFSTEFKRTYEFKRSWWSDVYQTNI